ncbi:hypothetical protein, partial [Limosilactobacillus fermentum]
CFGNGTVFINDVGLRHERILAILTSQALLTDPQHSGTTFVNFLRKIADLSGVHRPARFQSKIKTGHFAL